MAAAAVAPPLLLEPSGDAKADRADAGPGGESVGSSGLVEVFGIGIAGGGEVDDDERGVLVAPEERVAGGG